MRVLIAVLAGIGLAAAGFAVASPFRGEPSAPTVVRVVASDFSYSLSRRSAAARRVRFVVKNEGAIAHDFAIAGRRTPLIQPGKSASLLVTFARVGRFAYRCTVPGHSALGMKGVFVVGKAPSARPATTTTAPPATTVSSQGVQLEQIGDFARPVLVTAPRGDPRRVFVVEQRGTIREFLDDRLLPGSFLDLTERVKEVSERGLLSAAFAPDYASSGRFYVDYTDNVGNGNVNVVEYRRSAESPDAADPATARPVLNIVKPYENHNAGLLQFGPDGALYVAVGDGDSGVGHPPGAFAQTLGDLLGNVLRIDPRPDPESGAAYRIPDSNPFVDKPGAKGEVWDYGLRNPWRFWIDPVTGDMYIGDAGEGAEEEIDYVEGDTGGQNFGWPCFEGTQPFDRDASCPGALAPIYEYDHGGERCAIVGGVVVRDRRFPALQGRYLFGDYCTGEIESMLVVDGKATDVQPLGLSVPTLDSFGVDGRGRVYVSATDGGVYRLDPAAAR